MSAETLRRAASLMRERAEAASAGPWRAEPGGFVEITDADGDYDTVADTYNNGSATHIASWHPAVALAVAELLDDLATGVDLGMLNYAAEQTALAVARAYLGESA